MVFYKNTKAVFLIFLFFLSIPLATSEFGYNSADLFGYNSIISAPSGITYIFYNITNMTMNSTWNESYANTLYTSWGAFNGNISQTNDNIANNVTNINDNIDSNITNINNNIASNITQINDNILSNISSIVFPSINLSADIGTSLSGSDGTLYRNLTFIRTNYIHEIVINGMTLIPDIDFVNQSNQIMFNIYMFNDDNILIWFK